MTDQVKIEWVPVTEFKPRIKWQTLFSEMLQRPEQVLKMEFLNIHQAVVAAANFCLMARRAGYKGKTCRRGVVVMCKLEKKPTK